MVIAKDNSCICAFQGLDGNHGRSVGSSSHEHHWFSSRVILLVPLYLTFFIGRIVYLAIVNLQLIKVASIYELLDKQRGYKNYPFLTKATSNKVYAYQYNNLWITTWEAGQSSQGLGIFSSKELT